MLMAVLDADRALLHDRPGLLILADKGYVSRELDTYLTDRGVRLLRPSTATAPRTRPSTCSNRSATLKGQLELELHGGRTIEGVAARIAQRLLALTAAIRHNHRHRQPTTRSLIAYDH
ncbi:hypothetical protein GCM10022380_68770 [Amycolatopsis tucumanensis]|uniref:Transposase DDE domain-containing protein n=1 Tax=Amycolatopsis tucumanensis TaxID=401106 RepID=A0ABP7JBW0_9PSEU